MSHRAFAPAPELCCAIRLIAAANFRFAVKIQDIGKPEARRHEMRSKARFRSETSVARPQGSPRSQRWVAPPRASF
jgi:hypothetical protein